MRRERHHDPECQLCHRVLNDWRDLTTMYRRPADGEPGEGMSRDLLRICAARGCWEQANERGYFSPHQRDGTGDGERRDQRQ